MRPRAPAERATDEPASPPRRPSECAAPERSQAPPERRPGAPRDRARRAPVFPKGPETEWAEPEGPARVTTGRAPLLRGGGFGTREEAGERGGSDPRLARRL